MARKAKEGSADYRGNDEPGAFKGSSLDSFTSKPTDGGKISGWYRDGDEGRTKIMDYVNDEVEAFVTAWRTLKRELPKLRSSL